MSTPSPYSWPKGIVFFGKSIESDVKQFFIIHNYSNSQKFVSNNFYFLQIWIYRISSLPDIVKFTFKIHNMWSRNGRKPIFQDFPDL